MKRTARLQTQATILRTLASTFDMPDTREQLLALAAHCEDLANPIEANPPTDTNVAETI